MSPLSRSTPLPPRPPTPDLLQDDVQEENEGVKSEFEKGDFTPEAKARMESFEYESDEDEEEEVEREEEGAPLFARGLEDATVTRKCGGCKEWFTNVTIIEGLLKLVYSVVVVLVELSLVGWVLIDPETGRFTNVDNWQFATMFAFFAMSGFADIAFQTCLKSTSIASCEKIILSLAFWMEFILIYFRSQIREESEVHLYTLLLVVIAVCAVGSGLEPWLYRPGGLGVRQVWVTALCLHGAWYWQIAFILSEPFDADDATERGLIIHNMMMTSIFTWELLALVVVAYCIHLIVKYRFVFSVVLNATARLCARKCSRRK